MTDQKPDLDLNGWPRTIEGWMAPQKQPPIVVIKSQAEGAAIKIEMLARDR
jgi:hypothetical protein